jgi:hypothetical protein
MIETKRIAFGSAFSQHAHSQANYHQPNLSRHRTKNYCKD